MATRYLVLYDIADPERLRHVHGVVKAFGTHVQDSVYEALLTAKERVKLEGLLREKMHLVHDQVLFVDLGDAAKPTVPAVVAVGVPYTPQRRGSVIV